MPTVNHLMQQNGWFQGQGPDFYFPQNHPHIHVQVNNAARVVADWNAVKAEITFVVLSFGQVQPTVALYNRNPPGEQLESKHYDLTKKTRFETALRTQVGVDTADQMQRQVNLLTGMGIDI